MKQFWAFYSALPVLLLLAFVSFVFAVPSAAAPGIATSSQRVTFTSPADAPDANAAFTLANNERNNLGLNELIAHEGLGRVAQQRADDMAKRQYYAHKNPDGKYYYDLFDEAGVRAGYSCENLDLVFVPDLDLVMQEWKSSLKGHRECLMNSKTTMAGYGTAQVTLVDFAGTETVAYVMVAINAQIPVL